MTAHITQRVAARRRFKTSETNWIPTSPSFRRQRGSLTQQTVTIGFGVMLITSLSLLGFFYLQQVLSTASRGNDIHALENQLLELKTQQKSLELNSAELRSIQTIENSVNGLNLMPTDKVSYLGTPVDQRVATSQR